MRVPIRLTVVAMFAMMSSSLAARIASTAPTSIPATTRSPDPPREDITVPATPPIVVYLHGVCGDPLSGCRYLASRLGSRARLVCPTAPGTCSNGGRAWSGPERANDAAITRAIASVVAVDEAPRLDTDHPGVLVGFSQGAYVAQRLVRRHRGRYRAVAFVGAYVTPTRAQLEAAGVRRVALVAGRRDGTYRTLRAAAESLVREGFDARFVDLGSVGHSFVAARSVTEWDDALAWLAEGAAVVR